MQQQHVSTGSFRSSELYGVTIWRSSKRPAAERGVRRANRSEHPGDLETTAFRQSSRGRAGLQVAVRGGQRGSRAAGRQGDEDQPCTEHRATRA